jgi:hypothetical protein
VKPNTRILLPVIAAIAAGAAFWMLVLSPKREEIATLDTEIAQQQDAVQAAESQAAEYAGAKDRYRENYAQIVRLGKAVPGDDDVRSLLVQLDSTAKASKVDFEAVNVAAQSAAAPGTTGTATGGPTAPPGAVSIGTAGFSAMPFTFSFSGGFFRLTDFMDRLEVFVTVENENIGVSGRLLLIGSIAVQPETGSATETTRDLKADIGAAAYLLPPAEDVTGAPAEGGAAPAAGTTPASSTTPTTTTATITGVR